jgi:hypothetical protein
VHEDGLDQEPLTAVARNMKSSLCSRQGTDTLWQVTYLNSVVMPDEDASSSSGDSDNDADENTGES